MCLCKHIAFLVHAINDAIKQKTEALSCAEAAAVPRLDVVQGVWGGRSPPLVHSVQIKEELAALAGGEAGS